MDRILVLLALGVALVAPSSLAEPSLTAPDRIDSSIDVQSVAAGAPKAARRSPEEHSGRVSHPIDLTGTDQGQYNR